MFKQSALYWSEFEGRVSKVVRYTRTALGVVLASLIVCVGLAHADTFTYDFSGNLNDHFMLIPPAGGSAVQSNGELQFSAAELSDISGDGTNQIFAFTPFVPTYGQSWSAKIDVKIPSGLDVLTNQDWYLGAGLGVFSVATDGTFYSAFNALEIGNDQTPAGRKFNPEVVVDDTEIGDGEGVTPTSAESATLTLSFDASTKTLTFGNLSGVLRTVDTGLSNLQATDPMSIVIGFSGAATPPGVGIPQDTPVTLDNFSVTTAIPEPDTYVLLVAGLGVIGWTLGRPRKR